MPQHSHYTSMLVARDLIFDLRIVVLARARLSFPLRQW